MTSSEPAVPPAHPLSQHLAATVQAGPHEPWTPGTGALPVLFLSHGAPPLFEDLPWMTELFSWARALPRPRAILIVSAHWESAPLALSSTAAAPGLVYDFGGFDPAYYRVRYPTPDAGGLARLVAAALPYGTSLHEHADRGLDHGAWVPLKAMYPEADIPVLQLSIPTHDSSMLLALGNRLRVLREQGVLVIGSGFMTHGLPFVDFRRPDVVPGWSREFDLWAADALARGDVDELASFRVRAPGMPYSHPTVEHFTPLLVALGSAQDPAAGVTTTIEGWMYGLSRRSFQAA